MKHYICTVLLCSSMLMQAQTASNLTPDIWSDHRNAHNYPTQMRRCKVISSVVVVVDTKITKSGDLGM